VYNEKAVALRWDKVPHWRSAAYQTASTPNNKMPFLFIVTLYTIIIVIIIYFIIIICVRVCMCRFVLSYTLKNKKQLIKRSAHECYLYSRRPKTVGTVRRDGGDDVVDGGRNAAASRRATQWKKTDREWREKELERLCL